MSLKQLYNNWKIERRYPFLKRRLKTYWQWLERLQWKFYEKSLKDVSIYFTYNNNIQPIKDKTLTLFDNNKCVYNSELCVLNVFNDADIRYDYSEKLDYWVNTKKVNILGINVVNDFGRTFIKVIIENKDINDKVNYGCASRRIQILTSHFYNACYKVCLWINNNIIARLWHLPTYTHFTDIPVGWRKAFGKEMCEEIREALLKNGGKKALKEYQVLQIKEKFSGLRWYDSGSYKDVHDIIDKYEELSYHTCIECGKPATKISTGWICPYCDEHAPKGSKNINYDKNRKLLQEPTEK